MTSCGQHAKFQVETLSIPLRSYQGCGWSEGGDTIRQLRGFSFHNSTLLLSVRMKPSYIPFRESKLTRLFQPFFCGKGKACMIVNINQHASTYDETLHVMKFSAIAKQVRVHLLPLLFCVLCYCGVVSGEAVWTGAWLGLLMHQISSSVCGFSLKCFFGSLACTQSYLW